MAALAASTRRPSRKPELTRAPSPVQAASSSFASPPVDDLDDGEAEALGELPVALVVGGDGHDGAGAVVDQDVVGDPDGDGGAVDRVDRIRAREDSGLFLGEVRALEVALVAACAR
jgi:hypothetical protein